MTAALEGGEWPAARPDRFTPGKDPVPISQEAGWAPGPFTIDKAHKNSLFTGGFLMFSVLTNNYNQKNKGPTLTELFTATGKLKFLFDN